ncbi:venom protease-like [Diabrotica undecimpunctata]|uniref:venom protease-like n=1 Tax=Diabrotica undecimpunctata TaxID=50387 RepID=UPI003B640067
MISIIVIVAVVFLNLGNCNYTIDHHPNWQYLPNDICGTTIYDRHHYRIIGGTIAKVAEYPWLVKLGVKLFFLAPFINCAGTLITENHVVTAGHCSYNNIVQIGDLNPEEHQECDNERNYCSEYKLIETKLVFNAYDQGSMKYDIALMRLAEPVQFTEFLLPACLPRRHLLYENLLGRHVDVPGWGYIDNEGRLPNSLMHVQLPIIKKQWCELAYKKKLISSQLCIGNVGNSERDSCTGDSGGGITMRRDLDGKTRHYLVGIVSHGFTKCATGPAIYTSVAHYVKMILDHITE